MPALVIGILLIIISIALTIYSIYTLKNTHQINQKTDKENQDLENKKQNLEKECEELTYIYNQTDKDVNSIKTQLAKEKEQLSDIQNNISKTLDNQKELSQKAFENYCKILEKQYEEEEENYDRYKNALETSYSNLQLKLIQEIESVKEELIQIEATRAAAIKAQLKEKEITENSAFYCLQVTDNDLKDIAVLESIKPKLNNSRILSMLIWQTFFRTPMTNLCNNVIGKDSQTGIYKITNQLTKECYIGQSVDLASRWKDHAKCGIGIDTPAGNKLYKAMQEYGIQNFSWEVLEFCPREQLDEKEEYYIKLYQAKEYGYNGQAGNKK